MKTTLRIRRIICWALLATLACWQGDTPMARESEQKANFELSRDNRDIDRETMRAPASYAPILKKATPAVVSVTTARIVNVVRTRGLSPDEELMRRFFGLPIPRQVPRDEDVEQHIVPQGIGSGVIITRDGYILTNNHVVSDERGEDADRVLVKLSDDRELEARIVGRDLRTDIAVLKVDADDLPVVTLTDSEQVQVGDIVFAIGNPMGIGRTVTKGIISAKGRAIGIYGVEGYENFIQTDASINPGNSGGALIDIQGRLIGINSAILSRTGSNIGIGFAIPCGLALSVARHLIDFGEVRRGFLGVRISDLTPDMAEAFGLKDTRGALIDQVEEGLPADKGGIQRGDVIVKLDDEVIDNANELRLHIGQTPPGSEVNIEYIRDGKKHQTSISVADLKGQIGSDLLKGVSFAVLNEELRAKYKIPSEVNGLVVTAVAPDSPYVRTFREGMVVIEVNDAKVADVRQARNQMASGVNKFYVYDRGQVGYLPVRIP